MSQILEDLTWRGLIAQTTDRTALETELATRSMTFYAGFDPTAPSLHIGNLVIVLTMRRLQSAGHRPIALVGGATGLIGDPRMSGERTLNSPETVAGWLDRIRAQIEPFLDFDGPHPAKLVNNLDWTGNLSAIAFLRDIGKHFRMGTMLSKDIVARRLASDAGISFTEFSYQVLQGMDFRELFRAYDCRLQVGGSDQWGNLLAGVELIRKSEQASVHALTTPLITKADGTKFGKTEGGAVWLDPEMTTPYAMYQFWLNASDADVLNYLKVFTFRTREEIESLMVEHEERPAARLAQRALAEDVTRLVHGDQATDQALHASQALFGRGALGELDQKTLRAAVAELPSTDGQVGDRMVDLFVAAGLVESRGAARRAVSEGGLSVNNQRVVDVDATLELGQVLSGSWVVLRKGKRHLAVVNLAGDQKSP